MMATLHKGEKRYIGLVILCGSPFVIEEATYKVKTTLHADIGVSDVCQVDGADVYFLCDTGTSKYRSRRDYWAYFYIRIVDEEEQIIGRVPIRVIA